MTADNAIDQYKKIVRKINDIRNLLRTKLIYLGVDIEGHPSFNTLLSKVTPTDINSVVNKNLSDIPIDTTEHFETKEDIHNYFYTNEEVDFVLSQANLLLLRKFLFYREYLKKQLFNMGISQAEIKRADTIKNLILLLDRVERIRKVHLVSESDTLYVNKNTTIEIDITDDMGELVQNGIIKIYLGSQAIGTPYKIYQLDDNFLINVDAPGEYTFTIEYVNTNLDGSVVYKQYEPTAPITITLNAIYESLDGNIIAKNMNTQSKYYWGNDTEVAGFENDYWDFDIEIADAEGVSIGQRIPFDICMGDTDHIITSGITDSSGHSIISNVTIPYYSSDFISFREEAITKFASTNIHNDYSDEDILYSLSFIKNPVLENNNITYQRVHYTDRNTLNELNGCITDISIVNNELQYTTFNTSQTTKLKNIDNLADTLKVLVTEIFYDKKTNTIDYETINTLKYEYEKEESEKNTYLILKTKLNQEKFPDAEITTPINIYHAPISVNEEDLTWYKTDPEIPNNILVTFYDKYTGEPISHIDEVIYINVGEEYFLIEKPTYNYPIDINSLPYGDNIFVITLTSEPEGSISFALEINIKILSNFIFPSKTLYYLNDNPVIYYRPKGIAREGEKVYFEVKESNWNGQTTTDSNGILKNLKWNVERTYNLYLTAKSQNLTEERNFIYELKAPFTIEQTSYKKTQKIVYKLSVYDKEHFNWDNTIDLNDYVIVKNSNNQKVTYTYTSSTTPTQATFLITIPSNANTYGTNTIETTINGYSKKISFLLYEHLFEFKTTALTLGNQIIEIQTLDPDIETINISGNGITQNSVTKTNDTFYINCTITQAAPNGTVLTITDNQDITETKTIYISKADIEVTYTLFSTVFFTEEQITAEWQIEKTPTKESISLVFNNGEETSSATYNIGENVLNGNIALANTPGTHIASITFLGNNNYNSFVEEIEYTVMEYDTYVSDIFINDDRGLTLEKYSGRYDIKELVNDGNLVNGDLEINIELNQNERDIVIDGYINDDRDLVLVQSKDIHQYLHNIKINKQDVLVASIYPANYQNVVLVKNITLDEEGILHIISEVNENEEDIIMSLEINDEGVLIYKKLNDMNL